MGKKLRKPLCWTKGIKKSKEEEENFRKQIGTKTETEIIKKKEADIIETKEVDIKDVEEEQDRLRAQSIVSNAQSSLVELNDSRILDFVDFAYTPSPKGEHYKGYQMVSKNLPFLKMFYYDPERYLSRVDTNMLESYSEKIYKNLFQKFADEEIAYNRTVTVMETILSSINYLHECVSNNKEINPFYYFAAIRILGYLCNSFPIVGARATTICDIFRLGLFINTIDTDDIMKVEKVQSAYNDELLINNTIIRFPKITFYDGTTKTMPKKQRESFKLQFNEIYQKFQMLQSGRDEQKDSNIYSLSE